jgi:hypothetical protein
MALVISLKEPNMKVPRTLRRVAALAATAFIAVLALSAVSTATIQADQPNNSGTFVTEGDGEWG